ncbi:hypothetical protein D3C78_1241950 [compost metagenome]
MRRETGTRFSSSMSAESSSKPASRARMSSFLRTSWPERSSRGSGSVRPCCQASSTSSEKGRVPSYCWNSQERVPEKMPETPWMRSPLWRSIWMLDWMGSPAPTVAL